MSEWVYDAARRNYVDPDGTLLTALGIVRLRDSFADAQYAWAADMTALLVDRTLSVQQWEEELQTHLDRAAAVEYALGRGGLNRMGDADWLTVATIVQGQFDYLHRFAENVRAGTLTADQITARAQYYFAATIQLYERAHAAAWGAQGLPAWPGDGSTPCMANCRCYWRFKTTDLGIECTWMTRGAELEPCPTCDDRAAQWAPFFIPASTAVEA